MTVLLRVADPIRDHLAVLAGKPEQTPGQAFDLVAPVIYGTAFALTPELVVTAAHVRRNAQESGLLAVGRYTQATGEIAIHLATDSEPFDGIDLALLQCPGLNAPVMPFDFGPLAYFEPVRAIGFPFSIDPQQLVLVMRGFSGTVVTRRQLFHLPGEPAGYEVSFASLLGLSGAPLLALPKHDGRETPLPKVCGMMIENHTVQQGDDRIQIGVALDTKELLRIESRLVGGSIAERIFGTARLPPRAQVPIRNP
jgi:hypothetical protein